MYNFVKCTEYKACAILHKFYTYYLSCDNDNKLEWYPMYVNNFLVNTLSAHIWKYWYSASGLPLHHGTDGIIWFHDRPKIEFITYTQASR